MTRRPKTNEKTTAGHPAKRGTSDNTDTNSLSMRQLHALLVEAEKMRRQGRLDIAEKICRKLLETHPTYLGALQTFGLTALEKKNYPQAVNCFMTAAAEAPDDWTNYTNLAAAWLGLEVPRMAELMLREARTLNPKDPDVHFMLGEVFSDDREFEKAMDAYRQALLLDADHGPSIFKLCDCLINLGYFADAKELLLHLRNLLPDAIAVVHLLLQLPRGSLDVNFTAALNASRRQPNETEKEFANNKSFVRAAILDREGAHDHAWKALRKANEDICEEHKEQLKTALERRARDLRFVQRMPQIKPPRGSRSSSSSQLVPLFILGPSRAGKTTLETLLAHNSGVKRGYENHNVEFAVTRAAQSSGLVTLKSLQLLPEAVHQSFVDRFRDKIAASSGSASVVTNTNPGLIGSAGRLAQALPEARFVFMTRDQNDTVLRMLMKKYRTGNHHAYSLKSARQYIRWYDEMTTILEQKLPDRALRMRYEDMVDNPVSSVTAVLALCGLESENLQLPEVGSDVGAADPYRRYMGAD